MIQNLGLVFLVFGIGDLGWVLGTKDGYWGQRMGIGGDIWAKHQSPINKIEIQPIDALYAVLEFTTFSIYFVFNLSDIQT